MNLDTARSNIVNHMFAGYKDNAQVKQAYLTNGAKRFTEYFSDMHCYPLEVISFTVVSVQYDNTSTKELIELTTEQQAELAILDELDDRQARENFGKLAAEKLIAYFEQQLND